MKRRFISMLLVAVVVAVGLSILPATPAEATLDILYSSPSDGYLSEESVSWDSCRDSTSGDYINDTGSSLSIYSSDSFWIYRVYLYFDTSSLPDGADISAAYLKLYITEIEDNGSGYIYVRRPLTGPPYTYPHDPLELGDYDRTKYSTTDYGNKAFSAMSEGAYTTITITNPNNIIDKTGWSKILLLIYSDAADYEPYDADWLTFNSGDSATGKPELWVTHTPASAPSISTDPATDIATTTARLNSTLTDDGGGSCDVRFGYGETTQTAENFTSYDTVTDWVSDYTSGQHPYHDASGLTVDTPYFFRAQAKNATGTTTGDEETFSTLADLNPPTNFKASPTITGVALTWTKGVGSTQTLIRFKYDDYPANTTDGWQAYIGTSSSYTHTGLDPGVTIYYSAWGESGASYSTSKATAMATTLASTVGGDILPAPDEPGGWMQSPDPTAMSGIPLLYDAVNDTADSLEVPRATFWLVLYIGILVGIAFGIYLLAHSLLISMILLCGGMALGVTQGLLPFWFVFVAAVIGVGIGISRRTVAV